MKYAIYARARRQRAAVAIATLLLVAFAAACSSSATRPTTLSLDTYTDGSRLVGISPTQSVTLADAVSPSLSSTIAPAAVVSPDGRQVAYNAWFTIPPTNEFVPAGNVGAPVLRIVDLKTRVDRIVAQRAMTPAWREDFGAKDGYSSQVVVAPTASAAPVQWSASAADYYVLGWAGKHLLVAQQLAGESEDLLVFDGPGRVRMLAPSSDLVAISPDGRRAFVTPEDPSFVGVPEILDVATGTKVGSVDLQQHATKGDGPSIDSFGSWFGSRVVTFGGRLNHPALLVFHERGNDLVLTQTIAISGKATGGAFEPRFASATVVSGWGIPNPTEKNPTPKGTYTLRCDLKAAKCTSSPLALKQTFGRVRTVSRPWTSSVGAAVDPS